MAKMILPGTFYMEADIPGDFDTFFKDGIAVNRDVQKRFTAKPQEWEVYSLYLGLKALEINENLSYEHLRKKIVASIIRRKNDCGGFWKHNMWTNNGKEIHMRYTSAAIRLLIEAYNDALFKEKSDIISLLFKHLSFHERLVDGCIWFYHDSLESSLTHSDFYKNKSVPNNLWGSSKENQFVLNTHVDTLVTILYVLKYLTDLTGEEKERLHSYLNAGLAALNLVLNHRPGLLSTLYMTIDHFAREKHFANYDHSKFRFRDSSQRKEIPKIKRIYQRLKPHNLYFDYMRTYLKSKSGTFIHRDGFSERELCIKGRPAYYHVSNLWDFARLVYLLKINGINHNIVHQLKEYINAGIEYSFNSRYLDFIEDSFKYYGIAAMFCEIFYIDWQCWKSISKENIERYIKIRRVLPATPALLGYDPAVIDKKMSAELARVNIFNIDRESADILILPGDEFLIINYSPGQVKIEKDALAGHEWVVINQPPGVSKNGLVIEAGTAAMIRRLKYRQQRTAEQGSA